MAIWLTAALALIPIFAVDALPSQDGPAHIYVAEMLRLYGDASLPMIEQYFDLNWRGQPNLFVYVAAQPLLAVFSPAMAEKILAASYILLIPCVTLFLSRAAQRSALLTHLALWPMLYGFMFFFGFYNYCFGLLLAISGIACWLRMRRDGEFWPVAALCVLSITGYFVHLFPLGAMMLFIGVGAAIDFIQKPGARWRQRGDWRQTIAWRVVRRILLPPAIAMTPALVLVLSFLAARGGSETAYITDKGQLGYGLAERFSHVTTLSFNLSFGPLDALISITMILIGAGAFLARDRNKSPVVSTSSTSRPAALFAGLLLVFSIVFATVPGTISGHTFVLDRLLPFLYLCLVLWILHTNLSRRQCKILLSGLGVIGLLLPLYRGYQTLSLDNFMRPFRAVADSLEPNRTLLSIRGARYDDSALFWRPFYRVNATLHASAALAAQRRLIDLKIVQTNSKIVPLIYRDDINPYWQLPANMDKYPAIESIPIFENFRLEASLPALDFKGYQNRSGGRVDYLLVWGPVAKYADTPAGRRFLGKVQDGFSAVPLRAGADHLRLFKRRQN
ncbi:MAG: hypothetical protein JKY20_01575 [Alphaproteobacteria bacterium]|nr:hypothetical protein [Alphaproteobacteria bacterium]